VRTTIVVGVDGREGGRDALRLAALLAGCTGSALVAVSAYPFHARPALHGSPVEEAQREETQAMLEREVAAQEATARTEVVADVSPARALHRVAESLSAGMIVVGSTHRGTVGRVLAGDVALATLHGAPCPVAVAPRGYTASPRAVRRIGVAFDGTEESRQALGAAAVLAGRCGAEITALRVVDMLAAVATDAVSDRDWMTAYRDEVERDAREAVASLGVPAHAEAVIGGPTDELVRLSGEVDLLVAGARGWGPVRRILLGSTSSRLVRRAACPVLVVPRGEATGQPGEEPVGAERAATWFAA
jgi:nucleotide-binding universal stress UspA family protein